MMALFFLVLALANQMAIAQTKPGAGKARPTGEKKTTSITFEDELIEGEVKKPELMYLMQRRQFNFKRLIKLRENFVPEMGRTAEEVKTPRGDL